MSESKKMKKETKIVLWLLGLGTLITIGLVIGAVLLLSEEDVMADAEPRWLYVDFTVPMTASPQPLGILDDPNQRPPLVTEMADILRYAAEDEQVIGIRAEMGTMGLGWAQIEELRNSLLHFRESGKESKIWAEAYTNKEYYLASACNEILSPEAGIFLVNGLTMTVMYYADLFEELDIRPNFAHVGDFKSAVEPYERTGPSDSASEATNALLDSLYSTFISGIANGRELSNESVRELLNNPPITPQDAVQSGMIDSLQYRDQFLMKDNDDFEFFHWRDLWSKMTTSLDKTESSIAVIYAEGAIMNGSSAGSLFGGQNIGDHTMRRHIQEAIKMNASAIVLRISSPGGSGSASDAIWRDLQRAKDLNIPIVISMGDYAASGGYYISMISDYIYAQPNTITGSIGVFGGKLNLEGLYEKLGLDLHTYQRGDYANLFSSTSDFSFDERKKYQEFLNSFYSVFISKAADGRNLSVEQIHAVAQGRVWTGEQALEHKLIDEIGGLDKAIEKAAQLANLQSYTIESIPRSLSFFEELLQEFETTDDVSLELPQNILGLDTNKLRKVETLQMLLSSDPRLTLIPMDIAIE